MGIKSSSSDFAADWQEDRDTVRRAFEEDDVCGSGASCRVYRLRQDGVQVAVKRLNREHRFNPAFLASYRKEYLLGRQLKHDAIPVYRDFYEGEDEVYIVMEYVDGITLEDFIHTEEGREWMSHRENVRRLLTRLLDVTAYLHRSGVVHCDIKPSNIMLRHIDRGVMLLDLDKAYTDTRDRTHGGTADMSEPLVEGEKPTVGKDFAAIGRVLETISENVEGFPKRRFSRFLRECKNPHTNDDRLLRSLQSRSHAVEWIAGLMIVALIAGGIYYFRNAKSSSKDETPVETSPAVVSSEPDTVIAIEEKEPQTVEVAPVSPPSSPSPSSPSAAPRKPVVGDFDKGMAGFIQEAETAFERLRSGEATDKEIRDMSNNILNSYLSKYRSFRERSQLENPDFSGIDVELEVARVSEHSRASDLYQRFLQAVTDTLKRHSVKKGMPEW